MIHKFFIIIIVMLLPSFLFAQFSSNKHMLGPSIGFSFLGSTVQIGINHEYGINLSDVGIDESGKLGFGGVFRYWKYSENFPNIEWNYTDILLGLQTNYHFYMANDNVDPWFGIIIAYDFGSAKSDIKTTGIAIKDETHGGLWVGANAGMRYWFNNKIAMSIRIGFGTLSYGALDLGIDYKFD